KAIADLLRHRSLKSTRIYAKVDLVALSTVPLPWPGGGAMNARSTMQSKVEAYLAERRHAGFALRIEGQQLTYFARFVDASGYRGPLTIEIASRWATASRLGLRITAARRIEVLRAFARYCRSWDRSSEIPPLRLFGPGHRRLTPHIYT